MELKESKYTTDWFKKRALASLKRIDAHTWDYSDSLLLYISSGVEKYESLQEDDTPYYLLVTKPERDYLQSIAHATANVLPDNFEYIDLGPGTEHKEQFLFDELKKQGKQFTYIPVDISERYLTLAKEHAEGQGIPVRPLQVSLEEVAGVLGSASVPRFVNIGLTFSNYDPHTILTILADIAGRGGYLFINAQIRERVDMAAIQQAYVKDAVTVADDKRALLGLSPETDVTSREATDDVKVWCSIINPSAELVESGVVAGDHMLVFQSLRYTKEQLEAEVKKVSEDYQLFDTNASFVGVLIRS